MVNDQWALKISALSNGFSQSYSDIIDLCGHNYKFGRIY